MASYFNLTLDTIAPAGVALSINGGALYTASKNVTLSIGCSDTPTSGYTMKIWGIKDHLTEDDATWEAYATTKAVVLPTGDGLKTVYIKIRDNVWNESTAVNATITLNTALPVVTVVGPDVSVISKVSGKDTASINFTADQAFNEYKVGVVSATNSQQGDCTVIGTTGGSLNTSGTGNYAASENIQVTIKGADFQTAVGGSDGQYTVKVFVKNLAEVWSR